MNAKGDANRSVRMTKQRLYQALITLLQQKSLREITVRELTELAGISRGTFYFHYADIYALMDQMEAAQLPRSLGSLDIAVINGNYAIQADLKVADALAIESAEGTAGTAYVNVLAVKEGRESDPAIQALAKALCSDEVKAFIDETYAGAVRVCLRGPVRTGGPGGGPSHSTKILLIL